jgi:hypothetical protein
MMATKLERTGLDRGVELGGRGDRSRRVLAERLEDSRFVAFESQMNRLATHAKLRCHFRDAESISNDAEHGVVTLLHFA